MFKHLLKIFVPVLIIALAGFVPKPEVKQAFDGPEWIIYDGSVLPTAFDPAFVSSQGSANAITSVNTDVNLLRIKTLVNGDRQQWRHNYPAFTDTLKSSIVFRAKGNPSGSNVLFDVDLHVDTIRSQIRILTNGQYQLVNQGNPGGTPTTGSLGIDFDPLEWNTYRFVYKLDSTFLYVNENPDPVYEGLSQRVAPSSNRFFRFGDGWTSGRIDTFFNWIIWDQDNNLSPEDGPLPLAVSTLADPVPVLFSDKDILSFKLSDDQIGEAIIDESEATISLDMPSSIDVSDIVPNTFTVSTFATVDPIVSVARDFTNPVVYTVTAEDASTKEWTITVNSIVTDVSDAKDILSFKLSDDQIGDAVIDAVAGTVTLNMPNSSDLADIVPIVFTISPLATIDPGVDVARNFNSPLEYTITAEDATTKVWEITVNKVEIVPEWVVYDAFELPDAFEDSPFSTSSTGGTFGNTIVSDDIIEGNKLLQMTTADNGSNFMWLQGLADSEGATIVLRAKANPGEANMLFEMDLQFEGSRQRFMVLNNGSLRREFPGPSVTTPIDGLNTSEWNSFRFTKKGNLVRVYLNENETPIFEGETEQSTSNAYFRFGDGWGSAYINSLIDWIVWDKTGAYSPTQSPLPAGLSAPADDDGEPPVLSDAKDILAFKLSDDQIGVATIDAEEGTVTLTMPNTSDLSNLVPVTFTISPLASINPAVDVAQDFSSPVVYTITAEDESTKEWTITVNAVEPPAPEWIVYTADVLPNDETFSNPFIVANASGEGTYANVISPDPSIDGNNLLEMSTTANGSNFMWRQNLPAGTNNATIAVRVKANLGDANMLLEMDMDFGGSRQRLMVLNDNRLRRELPSPSVTVDVAGLETSEWNIFRYTKSGNMVRLYMNEYSEPIFEAETPQTSSNNHFRLGDGWGSAYINSQIDWIVWDAVSASSPLERPLPDGLTGRLDPTAPAPSDEKEILTFKLSNDQIGESVINSSNGTVAVTMINSIDITSLVPVEFTISEGASVAPAKDAAQNFSSPVVYTVTAEDGSTKEWTINVSQVDPNEVVIAYDIANTQYTGQIQTEEAGFTGAGYINFSPEGGNFVIFDVCQVEAGTRNATFRYALGGEDARPGELFVNGEFVSILDFPVTAGFGDWAEVSVEVTMLAGMNSIRLAWEETDGPNLDKLSLSGEQCPSFALNLTTTNGGKVLVTPERANKRYFNVETITLQAQNEPGLDFVAWSGDLEGSENPVEVAMDSDKTIVATFDAQTTFTLTINVVGLGQINLDPAGGVYAAGTTVNLSAVPVLGSSFVGYAGAVSGANPEATVVMDGNKSITATFRTTQGIDFDSVIGFASVDTGNEYPNFNGPTIGAGSNADTLRINGPEDFDMLAFHLYYRNRAYRNNRVENGVPNTPLVIVFTEGVYPEGTSTSQAWGNSMMTIQEQGDLTIIGEGNVILNWGFNIKRSWNIIIRNITFQDYKDDGINIGEPETHHIWVDHCTFGHPTTRPADQNSPDGGVDIKSGASYITVSWSKFRNSWKTSLIGHSDNNGTQDLGKLKVTLYANHYVETNSRNPRVRFGEVHFLNNLTERVSLYGIAASNQSQVYAENNFYVNTRWPMYADRTLEDFRAVYGTNTDNVFTSKTGNRPATALKAVGNAYDDSGLPIITNQINPAMLNPSGRSIKFDELNAENIFEPASYYSYEAYDAEEVRTIIPLYAGANVVDFFNEAEPVTGFIAVAGNLSPFEQIVGTPSASQSLTVSATDVSGVLTITPPVGFEVSGNNGASWFNNANPLTIASVDGAVAETTILVRMNASVAKAYSDNLVHSVAGAQSVALLLSGIAEDDPDGPISTAAWVIYNANELPIDFEFSPFIVANAAGTYNSVIVPDPDQEDNNLLHMTTSENSSNFMWRQTLPADDRPDEATIVVRARNKGAANNMVFEMDMDFGGTRQRIMILSNGEFRREFPSPSVTVPVPVEGFDPNAWNTYRYTKSADGTVRVYVNESNTPIFEEVTTQTSSNNHFRLGDGWGAAFIDTEIDYIIWDITGAYSPETSPLPTDFNQQPEPSPAPENPLVTVTGSVSAFEQLIGEPSLEQTYLVAGQRLIGDITITPPANFEVSLDGETWFNSLNPLVLIQTDSVVQSTSVRVRLNAAELGSYSGAIAHTSSEANTVNLNVSGATVEPEPEPVPTITLTSTFTTFRQNVGEPSMFQIYNVSGVEIEEGITITPPAGFEIRHAGALTWTNDPIVLPANNGVVNVNVSVRLNASAAGAYSGNITHTSEGAEQKQVGVNGLSELVLSADLEKSHLVHLYPNPVQDRLQIELPASAQVASLTLIHVSGKTIATQELAPYSKESSLDMSTLPSGTYILIYQGESGRQTIKILKN